MYNDPPTSPEPKVDCVQATRRRGKVRRTLILTLGLAALWLVLVSDAGLFRLVLLGVGLFAGGALVVGLGLAACCLGYGLFGAIDRGVAFYRRAGRWPEDERPDDGRP